MKRTLALLLAASAFATPGFAQELRPAEPSVFYYYALPFGGESRRDNQPFVGFALQGRQAHQALNFDSRMMNFIGGGVIEAKYLIIGAVAAGAALAAGGKDKSVETQQQQQAQAQQQVAAGNTVTPCEVKACFLLRSLTR